MNQADITLRPARAGDGAVVYEVTLSSVRGLQANHYSTDQINIWMSRRTEDWHESLITNGRMVVAERNGKIVGFVQSIPGRLTGYSLCRARRAKDSAGDFWRLASAMRGSGIVDR
jgi:hypothetical protein